MCAPCAYDDPMDILQFKIRLLRKNIKGWAININVNIRKQKLELLKEFDISGREMARVKREREDEDH